MEEFEFVAPKEQRNPVTQAAFRRQVWLQIYLPLAAGILLVGGAAALLWRAGAAGLSAWADASLLLLLLPVLLVSLLPIVLLSAMIYGVGYLMGVIPAPAHRAQQALARVQEVVQKSAGAAVEPILRIRAQGAAVQAALQGLASVFAVKADDDV